MLMLKNKIKCLTCLRRPLQGEPSWSFSPFGEWRYLGPESAVGLLLYSTMLSHGNPLHDWQCSKQQCEMVLKTVLFGPCLMYRDFSDALKHPKIHPRTKLADNLALFVRGPLRVRAPVLPGEVNPLNSAPPLWGGDLCRQHASTPSSPATAGHRHTRASPSLLRTVPGSRAGERKNHQRLNTTTGSMAKTTLSCK